MSRPWAVSLGSSGAEPGIPEEPPQVHAFGKEAVKFVQFARKLKKAAAELGSHDE